MVRQKGLEPSRREALEPKSSVSTNFTTGAQGGDYSKSFRFVPQKRAYASATRIVPQGHSEERAARRKSFS